MAKRIEFDLSDASSDEEEEDLRPGSEQIRRAHEDRSTERRKTLKRRERQTLTPEVENGSQTLIDAQVVRTEGAFFITLTSTGEEIRAKSVKSTRTENPSSTLVAVGDKVRIELPTGEGSPPWRAAVIAFVKKRKTKLARKAAGRRDAFEQVVVANIDLLFIVTSALEPMFRPGIIDRYIVAGLEGKLEIAIAINKMDLADEDMRAVVEEYIDLYNGLGYHTFGVSTKTGEGIDELQKVLTGKTTVFAGHSGVGKSSIINYIFKEDINKTGRLSKKYGKGAHTTTSSLIMPIPGLPDSFVVDTPGVREFSNYELDSENLKFFFVEFLPLQQECQLTNCMHVHEPGCAIIEAVEKGEISADRYASYLKLYDEAKEAEKKVRER